MSQEIEKKISDLRIKIDNIDEEIVAILNKRAEIVHQIRLLKQQAKKSLFDPKREEEIYEKIFKKNIGPLFNENLQEIFEKILQCMKSFE